METGTILTILLGGGSAFGGLVGGLAVIKKSFVATETFNEYKDSVKKQISAIEKASQCHAEKLDEANSKLDTLIGALGGLK